MLTRQEIFEKAVTGLLKQNKKAIRESGDCQYRTSDGLKCGVGMVIDDAYYDPEMEDCTPRSVTHIGYDALMGALTKSGVDVTSSKTINMLVDLQILHDKEEIKDWKMNATALASRYGLSTEFIDKL